MREDTARKSFEITSSNSGSCCGDGCCDPQPVSRRDVLQAGGLSLASLALVAGPFAGRVSGKTQQTTASGQTPPPEAFVPADKKLTADWVRKLYEKGQQRVYRGDELRSIGMPIGGVAAGQVYLTGDGRLAHWEIFNHTPDTGFGATNYAFRELEHPLEQGFALKVTPQGGQAQTRTLDQEGFPGVTFVGEYPLGWVTYADEAFPVQATLEAFSPFIPLNAADSGLPATVLRYTLENTSDQEVTAELTGWLENAVLRRSGMGRTAELRTQVRQADGLTLLESSVVDTAEELPPEQAPPEVFADFEGDDYGNWKTQGQAFGNGPARGTLPNQQPVSGFEGRGLASSFHGGDGPHGRLTSPTFTIRRPFITFLVAGGNYAGKTCVNLVVDGKVVRTATGRNSERLEGRVWDVRQLVGREAYIELVDEYDSFWGHISADQFAFADRPPEDFPTVEEEADFGTMVLATLGEGTGRGDRDAEQPGQPATRPIQDRLIGSLSREVRLAPGEKQTVTFIVAWHFPNRPERGQFYATRFDNATAVAGYVAENLEQLRRDTLLWHDTYYDSTLPHWLLDRLHMPVSTLATSTVQWWENGRFWAWEGVGCCHGTCTHVWNYAQAAGRLFPELERSAREMQDFGEGFHESGLVGFRGNDAYAADGQAGTILKAYREHLMSPDKGFIERNWPRIRQALAFSISHDAEEDGLIEGEQHNTFDIEFFGPNTFVGSLYLAALRAGEEMARLMGDTAFADRCRRIFEQGRKLSDEKLFDGEYYIQLVNLALHPQHQYGNGCLSDQVFGQNWAVQLGLGDIYNRDNVRSALASVYKYNWTPDIGPYNEKYAPERWFARAGEAGLFTCTFPKSDYLERGVRYREEVWTGIEYQVASHMLAEGMLTEGLAIVRGIHERYDAARRNPWNEVECGDHYARALASWGCLLNLAGFEYDGPAGRIAFAPRMHPEGTKDFRVAFTGATGWGTYDQTDQGAAIRLKWGDLHLTQITVPLEAGRLTLNGEAVEAETEKTDAGTILRFEPLELKAGDELSVA